MIRATTEADASMGTQCLGCGKTCYPGDPADFPNHKNC